MKPIFEYTDYREWIRDAFDDFKQRKTVISWRYMAMKLGADPGNLLRVSQGKIHLTLSLVKPMAEFFELDEKETAYWTELVCFGRAKTDAEALNHYEKMQILKGIPLKRLAKKELEFYRHWYCNSIRSIIGICRFKDDYEGLAECCTPPITVEEAKSAVKLLYDLNMISKDRDGYWKVNDTFVSTGGNWRSEAVRTFQKETIRLAGESLERHAPPLRDISTVTMTFNMDDIALIREKIKEFRSELLRLSQEGDGDDTVFQLNVQLFPIGFAKKLQEKEK
ncbi:MAG: TIGR02147 family protein [Fibrobacter sp.]|uniref:TIGR02147 family protein n=1 Tax=unclassified Fibrobacter TaxID=2634177 RepID=UPI00091D9701|nr:MULTISPECIES: TIGR02147 family protein [unclassified Fibrobacter]MBQ3720573.1 TIGR02147 family protein [Fibrobacter sp.]MBR2058819.1 TIGR02147 family protein [Fibrobacter sp.]MBR2307016.1 TIGR02147 family protein [Fibrobacter sp.]MBR4006780.1 TIGR02147 family protein [Fibrobacter sp.]SHG82693.1 TIGR02147 family protein [Fibrobacter sp. UWCM]